MADGAAAGHGGKDRLNGLHDDLLRQIIVHLPFTDAARTSLLASRWRHLWRSTPLVIDDAHLPVPARATSAVAGFLANDPGPFATVRLRNCRFTSLDPTWPRLLAGKGTRNSPSTTRTARSSRTRRAFRPRSSAARRSDASPWPSGCSPAAATSFFLTSGCSN
ncbi:hypothetical protein QYE76_035022 [Lolium multiflorum]|uniref:F-box domain-containing protein n=1 Tax=Lolium multiflorum TaxID=4521 RepID=A0AAD8R0R9_LOLMU|nr:hypothetical protein QYE76_035022 [Lolium multiflorum]